MKLVVMIGPSPASHGGMASVIKTYLEHGYGADGHCRFLPTQVDGSRWRKLACAGAALARFTGLLLAGRVGLLHVHVASGASFWRKAIFMAAARLFRVPVLLHLHGGSFIEFVDQRLSGWRQRLALNLVRGCVAGFALTEVSAAWLRRRGALAAVEVFPNPVAMPAAPPATGRAGLRDILFLGRLRPEKGVFDLLQAFALVHARRPDARLVLAGDGDQAALQRRATELGVAAQLRLPGWVDSPARAALMAAAAVFVLPSHHEQMPMSILEAMAAGVPVVATDVGGVALMLLQGKCGILVRPSNIDQIAASILCILDDNILAETISEDGLERIRSEYRAETVMLRLRRRYEELAG